MSDQKKSFRFGGFSFSLPFYLLGVTLGLGAYDFSPLTNVGSSKLLSSIASIEPAVAAEPQSSQNTLARATSTTLWQSKEVRGIYLSRYQVTGDAKEKEIRSRVRYYKEQGFNTIVHGVWGNGCPMYKSEVMQERFGMQSCPNAFREDWLDWLIDEAHKQDMQVHAYFEKGIKLDQDSPIFDKAISNGWFVNGVDRTYAGVDHRVLNVDNPEVSSFFSEISSEFVQRYPGIDAVQWDDYLGYHADLPGNVDRTASLTKFVRRLQSSVKRANPNVSFDLCHHNPYWGGRYFDADWPNWNADRAFIQVYNDGNFHDELAIAENYSGVAITENQLHRLDELVKNRNIQSILIFPSRGNPEEAAGMIKQYTKVR